MAFTSNNNFDSITEEIWAMSLQEEFYQLLTGQVHSRRNLQDMLSSGDTFNKSYLDKSDDELSEYVPGTDMVPETSTTTNEQLLVNKAYGQTDRFDDFETVQASYDIAAEIGPKDAQRFANRVDQDILAEVNNALNVLDNGVLSGSASDGVGITPDTSNIVQIFSHMTRLFEERNVVYGEHNCTVTPKVTDVIRQYLAGRDTGLGDEAVKMGMIAADFMGWDVYRSNQCMATAVLALATQPTNGDTVTIDGITFTFVTTIGATSGNVLIGANVDETRGHLAAFMADPGTTSADQVGFATTSAEYLKLNNRIVSATNDNTANTLTVKYAGRSSITVTETLTDATDTWTSNKTTASGFFTVGEPVDFVTQSVPSVEISRIPLQFGNYVKRGALYGLKSFRDGTNREGKVDFAA